MDSDYSEVRERLVAYRKTLAENQEEMAKRFDIDQGHYCKIENGHKNISYRSLKKFTESGGDICFLITGREKPQNIVGRYFERYQAVSMKMEVLKVVVWLTERGVQIAGIDKVKETKIIRKYTRLAEIADSPDDIWKNIRDLENLSQGKMATQLDINVKRYQRIETMQAKPDAEILYMLFGRFGYSPFVLLEHNLFPIDELNRIWVEFSEELKGHLLHLLEENIQLLEVSNK